MKQKIKKIIDKIGLNPGVYQMKNCKGVIIYIGKSNNLKSRVSSYFNDSSKLNFAKKNMVKQIDDIETIETKNEVEALILETNLIKKHKPKYNILLKDDKNLSYIKITNSIAPEVIKTRIKTKDGIYFGPYPSNYNITNTLNLIKKLFKIRSCKIEFKKENSKLKIINTGARSIPCIDYYIGLCPAPCTLEKSKINEYKKNIKNLEKFLKGDIKDIIKNLEKEMFDKSSKKEFEEAAKIRDKIKSIKEMQEKQVARDVIPGDNDVLVFIEKNKKMYCGLTQIRGALIDDIVFTKIENKLQDSKEDLINAYLLNKYIDYIGKKITIITNEKINNGILVDFLKTKKIKIENPGRGNKIEVINFTKNNLLNYIYKQELQDISKKSLSKKNQENILTNLGIKFEKKKELIFECFDISHLAGTNTVASKSVIINGKTATSRYKKYKLKTIKTGEIDDFKSIQEVLERRSQEGLKLNNMPDLIIIDGGKGQLSSGLKAIKNVGINYKNICSIAKREEEIFIPGKKDPIIFDKGSPELSLIQKIRDESHRFAINYNREKRNKELKKNILEEIPGLGPKTRQKLLKEAGSIDGIKKLPREKLNKILNKNQVEKLEEYLII